MLRYFKTHSKKYILLDIFALIVSTVSPIIATLVQFPLFQESQKINGIALICILLAITPVVRIFKHYNYTPSAPLLWGFVLVLVYVVKNIINQLWFVSLVGAISNLIAFCIYEYIKQLEPTEKQQ